MNFLHYRIIIFFAFTFSLGAVQSLSGQTIHIDSVLTCYGYSGYIPNDVVKAGKDEYWNLSFLPISKVDTGIYRPFNNESLYLQYGINCEYKVIGPKSKNHELYSYNASGVSCYHYPWNDTLPMASELISFPINYGSVALKERNLIERYNLQTGLYDSVQISSRIVDTITIDGKGTVELNGSTVKNVFRQKIISTTTEYTMRWHNGICIRAVPIRYQISIYRWWKEKSLVPIAQVITSRDNSRMLASMFSVAINTPKLK